MPGVRFDTTVLAVHLAAPWVQPLHVLPRRHRAVPETTLRSSRAQRGLRRGDRGRRPERHLRHATVPPPAGRGLPRCRRAGGRRIDTHASRAGRGVRPVFGIDHVLVRNCTATAAQTVPVPGSDHRGLFTGHRRFRWTRPQADRGLGWHRVSRAIYVASPEGDTGKSTVALGILHRLAATVAKVGVFRPITRLGEDRDYILELLLSQATAGLPYEECVGVSYQQLHEDPDAAIGDIVDRYHRVADQCDAVLIVGSDYTDVAAPSELSTNARIAANLGAPIVLAVKAKDRTPEQVAQIVDVCLAEVAAQHAHTAAVVANRCDPEPDGRDGRRAQTVRAEVLRAARGAAVGRPVGGRVAGSGRGHGDRRRSGAAVTRGDGRAGGRNDRRARAGTAEGRCGRHHPRRPIRCRARGRECPCRRRLSVAVLRHPQRRAGAASVDRLAGVRAGAAAADHHDQVRHVRDGEPGRRRRGAGSRRPRCARSTPRSR